MKIVIAENIKKLRTEKGISQETLSERMGVSVQAVSKWENGLSCPDISLLPELGEFFGVTVDFLLTGKEADITKGECGLPNDGRLRIVQARGNKILGQNEYDSRLVIKLQMPKSSEQPRLNVDIWGSCSVDGDVNGNIQCGNGVSCANVGGGISCGDGVNCGNVGGGISAGDGVNCGNVGGSVTAGDDIHCGDIGADASTGGDIECAMIFGSVRSCEGDIDCTEIQGDVRCEGDITIQKDKPNRKAFIDNGFFNKK
ncbi:MAG: helix-turn-helix domain-containing protein [Oscillospiraceae bacterium]|nr:helix-turn-helix domain-containing protein [Oscillospiraceae bacterium]